MKASELINKLVAIAQRNRVSGPVALEAARAIERFIALADELEVESTYLKIGNVGYRQGVLSAAKRIREIAEEKSDEQ